MKTSEWARERNRRWKAANPDKVKAAKKREKKRYYARKPEKLRALVSNCRARELGVEGRITGDQLTAMYKAQAALCAICGADLALGWNMDHIIPLSRGGSNWIANIQLLCPRCNMAKSDMLPHELAEWARIAQKWAATASAIA